MNSKNILIGSAQSLLKHAEIAQSQLQPYVDDGCIDPGIVAADPNQKQAIGAETLSVMARVLPKQITNHYIFDIETFGLQANILHFAIVKSFENGRCSEPLKSTEEVAEFFEKLLLTKAAVARKQGTQKPNIRVWAHNGPAFDYAFLAHEIEAKPQFLKDENGKLVKDEQGDFVLDTSDYETRVEKQFIHDEREVIPNALGMLKEWWSIESEFDETFAVDRFQEAVEAISATNPDEWIAEAQNALSLLKGALRIKPASILLYAKRLIKKVEVTAPRKGLVLDSKPLLRHQYWKNPVTKQTPKANPQTFKWTIQEFGNKAMIKLELLSGSGHTNGEMTFIDSMFHLKSSIDQLGEELKLTDENGDPLAKGITPLQNTDPIKWGQENLDYDIEKNFERFMSDWHNTITPEAVKYCENDCEILRQALLLYRDVYQDAIDRSKANMQIDVLNFMTSSQAGNVLQIAFTDLTAKSNERVFGSSSIVFDPQVMSKYSKPVYERNEEGAIVEKIDENGFKIYEEKVKHGNMWTRKAGDALDLFLERYPNADVVRVPIARHNTPTILNNSTFTVTRPIQERWGQVFFGGRTEIFSPITPSNHYSIAIDRNSMYPSIMADPACRLINTDTIKEVGSQDIVGRAAILDYFEKSKKSGMYLIVTAPALNPLVREYPIFPIRLESEAYDSQLIFADWKGELTTYVTGEELKYFLQLTEVENDNIRIIARKSFHGDLLNYTPLAAFARTLYSMRLEARKSGNHAIESALKLLLNSAGFGVFAQINGEGYTVNEMVPRKIDECLRHLKNLSPFWYGWEKFADKPAFEVIKKYAFDYNRPVREYRNNRGELCLKINLQNRVAPHALRPWAAAITAHARVKLHQAMMSVKRAGFSVEYVDTDSVHFAVPLTISEDDALSAVAAQGLSLGEALGQWKNELPEAEKHLVNSLSDTIDNNGKTYIKHPRIICLAPKQYVLADQLGNCLAIKAKGIPRKYAKMRAGLLQFAVRMSNIGDRRGVDYAQTLQSDLMQNIGLKNKRNFVSATYSTPLVLEQPKIIKRISWIDSPEPTYYEYKMTIGSINGMNDGILIALENYKNLRFGGQRFEEIRKELEAAYMDLYNTPKEFAHTTYAEILRRIENVNLIEPDIEEYE